MHCLENTLLILSKRIAAETGHLIDIPQPAQAD